MKTIEEIRDLMVGKSVITDLADLLRANDAEFAESEKKYLAAVETLRSELPTEFVPTLDAYLDACETDVISGAAYAGYLGFRVNLENFHHPIGVDFVRLDTIDYLKEHMFGHFPINYPLRWGKLYNKKGAEDMGPDVETDMEPDDSEDD